MLTIDADAHVIENETTWDHMLESERRFRPKIVGPKNGKDPFDYWLVDGHLIPRTNVGRDLAVAAREMSDLEPRIKHMDELGIDLQVIYPTFFITPLSRRPDIDLALCRSYNRWMADIVKKAPDRFRWVVVPPLQSTDHISEELNFGKENGACGVYMRGLEAERMLSDPYFDPLYQFASDLDLPICVHSANGAFTTHDFYADDPGFCKFKLTVIGAFHSLVFHGIPQRFPKLKIGIIEVSSQWIPYAVHDLARRFARRGKQLSRHPLKENRIYVTCQTDDDLDHVLTYAGEDNLVIGTDYGHADNAAEIEALRKLRQDGKVSAQVIDKILKDNPCALYGL
ncbi:MAG TPA: amidohydrolase family protein [Candidatus Udaeobacter sp.]|jgi:predicted TIM-barrel fold metal-dependent hydrolase|nr:amidohydrolase family protein [Candidatus Udaeobacter sp.]